MFPGSYEVIHSRYLELQRRLDYFSIWHLKEKSHRFAHKPRIKLALVCTACERCDRRYPSCLRPPAATAVIMGLHRGNSGALDSPCAIVIKKSGLILPYPSPTYWKALNWWMRTLWEMAGVVMPVIFLQMYLPLGGWREGWTTTFLDPEQAETHVGRRCHIGGGWKSRRADDW